MIETKKERRNERGMAVEADSRAQNRLPARERVSPSGSRPLRVGVFRDQRAADRALRLLMKAGFPAEALQVVCPPFPAEPGGEATSVLGSIGRVPTAGARTPLATLVGAGLGAIAGGAVVTWTGFSDAGTLVWACGLGLGALTGALTGGFLGAMATRGREPEIADYHDQALGGRQVLVSVDTAHPATPDAAEAERVLALAGAEPTPLPRG